MRKKATSVRDHLFEQMKDREFFEAYLDEHCPKCEDRKVELEKAKEEIAMHASDGIILEYADFWQGHKKNLANEAALMRVIEKLEAENARLKEENKNLWDLAESVKTLMDSTGSPSEYRAALVELHLNYECCVGMRRKSE